MAGEIEGGVKNVASEIKNLSDVFEQLSSQNYNAQMSLENFSKILDSTQRAVANISDEFAGLSVKLSEVLGPEVYAAAEGGLTGINIVFKGLADVITGVVSAYSEVGSTLDGITSYSRTLNKELFATTARFGEGLEAAQKYGDYITANATRLATSEFGYIDVKQTRDAFAALANAGIPLEKTFDIIESGAGSTDLLTTAILQSQALGMSLTDYMTNMATAMNRQGLSTQQAAEQMAMFGDVSQKTGFRVDTVARTLTDVASGFSALGMSADFGRPILEGFTNSLKGMGLGFENALELSSSLSKSIANLSSNYAIAYLTFQRGGLDMGGGGTVLGASIGMRSRMLESEKRGEQGQMGLDIAGAIKDTLESFTGGEIVTVTQAAESPELQSAFFAQTKMLESMYGITDVATQDRTLELLKQIEEATQSGDMDLAESLGKDLKEATDVQDKTLGFQEKTAKYSAALFAETQYMHKDLVEALNVTSSGFAEVTADMMDSGFEKIIGKSARAMAKSKEEAPAPNAPEAPKPLGARTPVGETPGAETEAAATPNNPALIAPESLVKTLQNLADTVTQLIGQIQIG